MSIIDVTDWEKEVYVIGRRKKYLYVDPITRRKAYFKYPWTRKNGDVTLGEVWSEKIAADIGQVIKIPTPEVFIAKNNNEYGSLSYSFLENEEQLYHGVVFLNAYFEKIFKTTDFDPINIKFPRLDALLQITESFKVQKGFIDILIFDALIGNCDRHSENWD